MLRSTFTALGEKLMLCSEPQGKRPSLEGVGALLGAALAVIAAANLSSRLTVVKHLPVSDELPSDPTIPGYVVFVLLFSRAIYLDATVVVPSPERGTCWRWG